MNAGAAAAQTQFAPLRAWRRWLRGVALALMLATGPAAAADDWLDDMPSVATVVEVVRQSVAGQVRQYPQLAANPDYLPMQLIGTFVLLRWVMEFQIETQGELSPERTHRMQQIANDYMQAEFAIGLGTARRNGRVKNECQKDGPNRADFKTFPSTEACHRYVTQKIISNVYISFDWRNAIFPLIFCDHAKVYLELMQNNMLELPAPIRSPAVVGTMPESTALLGPLFCNPYGGDVDGNGLCDDWEKPVDDRSAAAGAASTCAPIVMDKVRLAPGNGLVVTLAKNGGKLGATASFRVSRSSRATLDADAKPFWTGDAKVQSGPKPGAPLQVILGEDRSFRSDPTNPGADQDKPWLIVEVTSGGSPPPVNCGQPLPISEASGARTHSGVALFGPYSDVGKAIFPAGFKALVLTGKPGESGFVVLRREQASAPFVFYATSPVPATGAIATGKQPKFLPEDYRASILGAFKDSCEERENFTLIGTVHTHPSESIELPSNDNFSMEDFNGAIKMSRASGSDFGGGVILRNAAVCGIFLIPMGSLKILMFIADPQKDELFSPAQIESGSLSTFFSGTYDDYKDRQKEIGHYPQSIKD